jgi:hypothetical protein
MIDRSNSQQGTIEDLDYESEGRGVIMLTLAAALAALLFIWPIVIRVLTARLKLSLNRKSR